MKPVDDIMAMNFKDDFADTEATHNISANKNKPKPK